MFSTLYNKNKGIQNNCCNDSVYSNKHYVNTYPMFCIFVGKFFLNNVYGSVSLPIVSSKSPVYLAQNLR